MQEFNDVTIKGIITAIPIEKQFNQEITWIEKELKHKIIDVVGINKRHIAPSSKKLSYYAIQAGKRVLEITNVQPSEIGSVVFITQTGDQQIPSTVTEVIKELQFTKDTLALEVNLGCSGFVHGLLLAVRLLKTQTKKHCILFCGDISSSVLEGEDTGTVPLFSDGVSATIVSSVSNTKSWKFSIGNDATDSNAIAMLNDNVAPKFRGSAYLKLDGHKILTFGLKTVVPSVKEFLTSNDRKDIEYYFFHQASKIINEALRKKLDIPIQQFPYSLHEYGNTSSATIPITMCLSRNLFQKSVKIFICGFGTGLSWGNAILELEPIQEMQIIEV